MCRGAYWPASAVCSVLYGVNRDKKSRELSPAAFNPFHPDSEAGGARRGGGNRISIPLITDGKVMFMDALSAAFGYRGDPDK